ncbi:MAG: hypothetical protein L6V93_17115 [Clostridiales bacterium]|nr:MAG: hypothetical protein L6V93_17115 [Clostridiales bacterium]
MFNIRDIDIAAAKSTDFDENGIGLAHCRKREPTRPIFPFAGAQNSCRRGRYLHYFFQVDTSYLSDRFFLWKNNFANHSAVMLKSNRNGAFLRLFQK